MKYSEDFIFNTKTNKWYKNGIGCGYFYKEHCKKCGEPYFMRCDKPTEYCCASCAHSDENNPMYGKTHTDEVKQLLRENIKKTIKTIKNNYGVSNISQLDEIKIKKGQNIIDEEFISKWLLKQGYELLEKDTSTNKHTRIKIKCSRGHIHDILYSSCYKRHLHCKDCAQQDRLKLYDKEYERFLEYSKAIRILTETTYRRYKDIINPNNYKRGHKLTDYHLDHKVSIYEGFKNNVNILIMASPSNLELIKAEDNLHKGIKPSITIEELLNDYNKRNL